MAAPEETKGASVSAKMALKKMVDTQPPQSSSKGSANCFKRVMKELENITRVPHENITVLPTVDDMMFWNVYIEGPIQTPYEGGLFQAYCRFPSDYPFKPPTIRFVTPIYHCNINSTGRICHSILDQFYSPAITVKSMLDAIFGLLMTPEPMDPLDAYIASEFKDNYPLYEQKCREHVNLHASQTLEQLTGIKKAVVIPPELLDPISGNLMTEPVSINGKTYERSEIERVIDQSGADPDGQTAAKSDLVLNLVALQAIEEFKRNNP